MKRLSLSSGIGLAVATFTVAVAQPMPIYENFGIISAPPQIDALAFANYGTFTVGTTLPFDFQSTLNFTNTGTMAGGAGFQFDTASSTGPRRMAASFFNRNGGSITALDAGGFGVLIIDGQVVFSSLFSPSYLVVSASNVVNQGLLSVGAGGQLSLQGKKLNLSRGGFEVRPVEGLGFTFSSPTNFLPDVGIYDEYWGGVTNNVIDSSAIVSPGGVISPVHVVTNVNGFAFLTQLGVFNPFVSVYTNRITSTNWIVQAAFIGSSDTNIGVRTRFARSSIFTNVYRSIVTEVSFQDTNVVTGVPQVQTLYFVDRLASDTNYTVLENVTTFPPTYRPGVYELSRTPPLEFFLGTPGNSAFNPDLIYNSSMSNSIVTNTYAAYAAFIDSQPVVLQNVEGLSITNQPGRIEIVADELDMRGARMRGNSFVSINTKHLTGSANAVVDAPNLSFSLASTNGNLQVLNLAKDTVNRFGGFMGAWSGFWSNQTGVIVTNIGPDPNDTNTPPMTITNLATNIVDIGIHVLILDATPLQSQQPVLTRDFASHSTNIVFEDNMRVVDSFLLDGRSFTLNGRLQLSSAADYWTSGTAPTLQYFTNNGTLIVDNAAKFGNDRTNPYSAIVNNGTMTGASYSFRTDYFENSGTINPDARLTIEARSVKLQRGGSVAGNDVTIAADDVKMLGTRITTSAGFYLVVTNSLQDAGVAVSNVWDCQNGFNLPIKPRIGDLFGTTVRSTPPLFALAPHTWAAEDRGPTVEGYQNNAALGRLVLSGNPGTFLEFDAASTAGNALYVDYLDLEGPVLDAFNSDDLGSILGMGPGFVLYFSDSNVPAEELDGELGGTVRWVRNFAGPNSSVDVLLLNGQTVKMNRALRKSTTIDTDGDGVANLFDFYPLDEAAWNSVPGAGGVVSSVSFAKVGASEAVSISWSGIPAITYTVEFATSLATPDWQPLMNYTNVAVVNGTITVLDATMPVRESQRFYRLRNSQ